MVSAASQPLRCPRCGSEQLSLCGQSIQYGPEERPGQPLPERELRTLAYQCECGLAFTKTVPPKKSQGDLNT